MAGIVSESERSNVVIAISRFRQCYRNRPEKQSNPNSSNSETHRKTPRAYFFEKTAYLQIKSGIMFFTQFFRSIALYIDCLIITIYLSRHHSEFTISTHWETGFYPQLGTTCLSKKHALHPSTLSNLASCAQHCLALACADHDVLQVAERP